MLRRFAASFSIYRGLPRPVYALFAAEVLNGLGIFVFPFLTLYLTRILGMSQREAGDWLFAASLAYLPGSMLGGKLADRIGRRKVMLASQLGAGAFLALAGSFRLSAFLPVFVLLYLACDGVTDPARSAMTTDVTTPENRQASYSLLYLGHNLGFAGGPLIAGFLFEKAPSWLFWGNGIAALAASTLVVALVPETKPDRAAIERSLRSDSSEKAHEGNLFSALRSRGFLVVFTLLTTWYGFVYAQHRFALPLQAGELFGDKGAALYGSLMTLNALMVIALNAPIVAALKRFKPVANVAFAGVLYALGFGMLAFVRSPWLFFASTALWTIGEIVNATNEPAYVANHTPMSHRGRFAAILPIVGSLGYSASGPVGGRVLEASGPPAMWILSAALALGASAGLYLLAGAERRAAARARDAGTVMPGASREDHA